MGTINISESQVAVVRKSIEIAPKCQAKYLIRRDLEHMSSTFVLWKWKKKVQKYCLYINIPIARLMK